MSDCKHNDLKRTATTIDDGSPIYYCAAKCGSGLFVVTPLRITVGYGRPEAVAEQAEKDKT